MTMTNKSIKERVNKALEDEFQKLHESSSHMYRPRQNGYELLLVFDTRYETSNRRDMQTLSIDVHLFGHGDPSKLYDLIARIDEHFTDRILKADEFMVKFPIRNPIESQQTIDYQETDTITRIDLALPAKIYYEESGPEKIQITHI